VAKSIRPVPISTPPRRTPQLISLTPLFITSGHGMKMHVNFGRPRDGQRGQQSGQRHGPR
jgi:hypothetical protein